MQKNITTPNGLTVRHAENHKHGGSVWAIESTYRRVGAIWKVKGERGGYAFTDWTIPAFVVTDITEDGERVYERQERVFYTTTRAAAVALLAAAADQLHRDYTATDLELATEFLAPRTGLVRMTRINGVRVDRKFIAPTRIAA